jgi:hypothetical protein
MSAASEMSSAGGTSATTLGTPVLFQALRRIVRRHFFPPEDEIGRAIERAFVEFACEMRK